MTPLLITNSRLKSIATCTTQAWLAYAMRLTTPGERRELMGGKAAHVALAVWGEARDPKAMLAAFDEQYAAWAEVNVPSDDKWSWPNLRRILARWAERPPAILQEAEILPELTEYTFVVPVKALGPDSKVVPVVYVGTVDWGIRYDGGLYLVDHKLTGTLTDYWAFQWYSAAQISMYAWGIERAIGQKVVGTYVDGIEVKVVPQSERKCKEHGVVYAECGDLHVKTQWLGPFIRDPRWLQEWEADTWMLVKQWVKVLRDAPRLEDAPALAQEGRFTGACRFCEFQMVCETGRDPGLIRANLVERPMDPSEAAWRAQTGEGRT